jgi:hypothetical protein
MLYDLPMPTSTAETKTRSVEEVVLAQVYMVIT